MNILIGKIGKVIKFKNLQIATGGDTCLILFSTMSRMFPEHNFYFFGPNDLSKLTQAEYEYLFPNKNVFSVYRDPKIIGYSRGMEGDAGNVLFSFQPTIDAINEQGIKVDFALIFTGYVGNHTLCNCIRKKDGSGYCLVMNAFKRYAGPYVHVLNGLDIPLYTIVEDPRYVTIHAQDLFNREKLVLTQMTDRSVKVRYKHIRSYEDHTWVTDTMAPCTYAGVEKIFLMGVAKDWREKIDIQRKLNNTTNPHCIVLSNGHGTTKINSGDTTKNGRLPGYKEYIIDGLKGTPYENTHIYGKWDDPAPQEYPQIQDRKIIDLDDEIADAKYSFVYSIVKDFVTIKPYEMIVKGLIPFLHPDYDSQHLLKLPDYVYIKNPTDLANKMAELDADNEKYLKVLNECLDCIKPEYLDGSYVTNTIMRKICDDMGVPFEDHKGVPPIMDHFSRNIFDYTALADSSTGK
jgi:hypothetical protein